MAGPSVIRGVASAGLVAALAALGPLAPAGANPQADPVAFSPLTDESERAVALAVLDGYLKPSARGLVIERCATVLGRNVGTVETIYTAACKLRRGGWVVMCGDTGIGEFALTGMNDPATGRSPAAVPNMLIDFANRNCGGA